MEAISQNSDSDSETLSILDDLRFRHEDISKTILHIPISAEEISHSIFLVKIRDNISLNF